MNGLFLCVPEVRIVCSYYVVINVLKCVRMDMATLDIFFVYSIYASRSHSTFLLPACFWFIPTLCKHCVGKNQVGQGTEKCTYLWFFLHANHSTATLFILLSRFDVLYDFSLKKFLFVLGLLRFVMGSVLYRGTSAALEKNLTLSTILCDVLSDFLMCFTCIGEASFHCGSVVIEMIQDMV